MNAAGELEVYPREDERWAWRLQAPNGEILATDGGQGYENREDATRMARLVTGGAYRLADVVMGARSSTFHCEICGESTHDALGHGSQ